MVTSAELQVRDPDLGELLPVTRLATIVLPALELEDVDLGLLAGAHDLGLDRRALHERLAGADRLPIRREEHVAKRQLGARLGVEQREPKRLAFLRPELLP